MRGIALVPLLAACTATSDVTAHLSIDDQGDTLTVVAIFSIGEYSDYGLHDVDAVVATFRSDDHDLACNDHGCRGTIDLAAPLMADEPLAITVRRGGDTLVSTMMIPARIEIQPVPLFVSRSQDFAVTWSPATADSMAWHLDSCASYGDGALEPSLTTLTLPAAAPGASEDRTCTATLSLTRYRAVPAADGFAGGHVTFTTQSVTTFASTP